MTKSRSLSETCIEVIEKNLHSCYEAAVAAAGRVSHVERDLRWVRAWPALWPNTIYAANLAEAQCEARLGEVIEQIKAGDAPRMWIAGPSTQPGDLGRRLTDRGFKQGSSWAGMAVPLDEINLEDPMRSDCDCMEARTDLALREWAEIVNFGLFQAPADHLPHFADFVRHLARNPAFRFFIGHANRRPVTAAAIFLNDGVAGLYCVATREDARRQGYGRAVIEKALNEIRREDAWLTILQATAMGESLYRAIGYEKYCEIATYVLRQSET